MPGPPVPDDEYITTKPDKLDEIIDLRESGWTFQKIGDSFGTTRQAVQQMYARYADDKARKRMRDSTRKRIYRINSQRV